MIEGIKGESVEVWWPLVEEYLNTALEYSLGEYSITDIKNACISKNMQLWVKLGKETKGAFVTKIAKYPQKNLLIVILLGGDEFQEWRDEADALLNAFGLLGTGDLAYLILIHQHLYCQLVSSVFLHYL